MPALFIPLVMSGLLNCVSPSPSLPSPSPSLPSPSLPSPFPPFPFPPLPPSLPSPLPPLKNERSVVVRASRLLWKFQTAMLILLRIDVSLLCAEWRQTLETTLKISGMYRQPRNGPVLHGKRPGPVSSKLD